LFCVLLLGWPATSRGQLAPEDEFDAKTSVKDLAKDLFESTQARTRDLARARFEAARTQLHERYEKYRAGAQDATLDLLLESAALLAKAELGALEKPTPEKQLKPLATHWLYTLAAEQIVERKYRRGRVSRADFMQARQERLDAEIKLHRGEPKLSVPSLIASLSPDGKESLDTFDAKEAAKHAFETERTDLADLARKRRDAARASFQERMRKYQAGAQDATLDLLLKSVASLAEAELAALEKPTLADRLAPLAAHWLSAWRAEQNVEARYKLGRVSLADFMQARHARLDAEIKFRGAGGGEKLSAPFPTPSLALDEKEDFDGLDSKALAKAQFEAGQADLRDLARARRDAIRTSLWVRSEKYQGSRDATLELELELELEAARQLLEAELALHDDPAERLETFQRYWEYARQTENTMAAKYEVGRVGLADYAQARFARLDAEIRMGEARAKVNEK
jgi:hypothetical protein